MILIMGILLQLLQAQVAPLRFNLSKSFVDTTLSYVVDTTSYEGIGSNSINDMGMASDSLIFFGTTGGLSVTYDLGETFRSYYYDEVSLPRGAVSGLVTHDSVVAVAALVDTTINSKTEFVGMGLAYSKDYGDSWTYLAQPQESASAAEYTTLSWGGNSIRMLSVTTPVSNVTYDLAYSLGSIWAASWSSGLRRYNLATETWTPIPLPADSLTTLSCSDVPAGYEMNSRDPASGGNHNHKAFSVVAYDSVIWVGTAGGINRGIVDSTTSCVTWTHFTSEEDGLPGNWVVALYRQVDGNTNRIWAGTVNAASTSERPGIAYTEDDGLTWHTAYAGLRADNFASRDSVIYAATVEGLYKSLDNQNWAKFRSAQDALTGRRIISDRISGVMVDNRDLSLWIASHDGLAKTDDEGTTWAVERQFESTTQADEPRVYAYPNPFSPGIHNQQGGDGHVRFQYHITAGEAESEYKATIAIYDFSMTLVKTLTAQTHLNSGDHAQVWNGRNGAGVVVANGVYYCRLTVGSADYWTKVVVIN